jgi:predicted nucleic-acid-binding protein
MKAIDTNVLIRLLTRDDEAQAQIAYRYVKHHQPVLLNPLVVCETLWVLSKLYKQTKAEVASTLTQLLLSEAFEMVDADLLWQALQDYQKHPADFSDILIGLGNQKQQALTATFDKQAAKLPYFEMIV